MSQAKRTRRNECATCLGGSRRREAAPGHTAARKQEGGIRCRKPPNLVETCRFQPEVGRDMKFILTTHNVTLTDAIEQHVLNRLEKLEHIDRWLIDARVCLEKDHTGRTPDKTFKCSIRLGIRGRDLYAEDREADLYAAVDLSVKKIEQQLRQKHSRAKAKKRTVAARLKERRRSPVA